MGQCVSAANTKPDADAAATHLAASINTAPSSRPASLEASRAAPATAADRQNALDEAAQPILSFLLPLLQLQDLKHLGLTCSGLRQLVNSAPDSVWQQAASNSLPPRHPVLHAQGSSKAAAQEHGRLTALLRKGKKPSMRYVQGSKAVASAISPNEALLAIISRDGLLRFWELQTSVLTRITEASVLQATGVQLTWAPDSTKLLLAVVGSSRCVLARADSKLVEMRQLGLGVPAAMQHLAWAPDSQYIAVALRTEDAMHDVADLLMIVDTQLQPIWHVADQQMVGRFSWAPDSSALAFSSTELGVEVHEDAGDFGPSTLRTVSTAILVAGLHARQAEEAFLAEGQDTREHMDVAGQLLSAPPSQATQTTEALAEACGQQTFLALDWSQRQGLLALLPDALVLIVQPGGKVDRLPVAAQYAEWSPDSEQVLMVLAKEGFAKPVSQLAVLSVATRTCLWRASISVPHGSSWTQYVRSPQSAKFAASPCGKHVALLDRSQGLCILNAATGHEQLRREPNWGALETVNCWWSADGGRLFVHLEEGSISIFTFQKPASRKQRRSSMSAKQRILSSALAAVSLPPPN